MKTTFPYGFFIKEKIDTINLPISSLAPKILTDKKDIEKIQPYLNSLNKTINQKGITNIALTGGYGSGKSTIIKTFQNINRQHQYLNISLASFNDVADEEGNRKAKKEELERLLEVSILQQIFYHVKPSEIPDSRFKRIINVTDDKILSIAIGLIFWVVSTLILFKFDYINKINPNTWNLNHFIDWIAVIVVLFFLTGIGLFAKSVIRLFSNSKINKFNIKGELELGDNLDKSVFNEHIEEIIYFFERTKYDVVIIEDLDRFESTDIFTKLREINILLNNTKLITREINFLYAIKDEMFNDNKERVKFFEYIIPVIPFINPSNAGDQLTKMINEADLKGVLSKDFTEDVVTFIDDIDMRLLINIFHEYQLYRKNLINDIDQDCLFAIITYKNLFPADFGDLQKRKGNLYKFLSKKEIYVVSLKQKIQNQINEINEKITAIDNQKLVDTNELKAIYINALHKKIPRAESLNLDGKTSFSEMMDEDNFQKLIEENNISYYKHDFHSGSFYLESTSNSNFSFSDIEAFVNPDFSYTERKQQIIDKENNTIEKLKKNIEKLKNSKLDIESWSLKQIFEEVDINIHLNEFSENGLIRNLLLNGYLNENYNDYISLFHEVNLTKDDYSFERKLKSGLYSPFDYNLIKIENLLKRIPEKYFNRDTILNFDILDFLAENHIQYIEKYDSILKILGNDKKKSIDFVENYIDKRPQNVALFIRYLCKSWAGFWDYIISKSDFSDDKTRHYLKIIIKYADNTDILFFKNNSNIDEFIDRQSDFFSLINDSQYEEKIKEVLIDLDIKFKSLDLPSEETRDLFDFVYENNQYQINVENINLMANHFTLDIIEDELLKANYTTILNSGCTDLINYINENINVYVKNVLLKIPENISEAEEVIINLLNNESLNESLKFLIIKTQNIVINDLSKIDETNIKRALINEKKVSPDWNNLYIYYDEAEIKELDEPLIQYLNYENNYNTLTNKKLNDNNNKSSDFIKEFSLSLIMCNKLSYESYIKLMGSTPHIWNGLSLELLDPDKVEWMINTKFLSHSVNNFLKLKSSFPNKHILFLEKYQNNFIKEIENYSLDNSDILKILNSKEISSLNKLEFIKNIQNDIIIQDKEIGVIICNILAVSNYITLEYSVLESLFTHSNSLENRIKLLNKHIDKISNDEIHNLIEILGITYKEIFKKQHKPKFTNTSFHLELFEKLKSRNLIIKYELDKKEPNKIRVFAKY